tara:strand:- start:228 stop:1586 length:1359 start_codon:yes stop_codon:yes gene_type:complete
MSFSTLGLSQPLLQAIEDQGYSKPTDIQEKAIPVVLQGKDLMAAAATGTGKTASFVLPLLELFTSELQYQVRAKRIRALILVPTRELALQVQGNIELYAKHTPITSLAMLGGLDMDAQKEQLIEGVDILVATPGRLLDMLHRRALHLDELEVLVLDEADRMLDMGFIADINKIIERCPAERQNLFFSATLSDEVRDLVKTSIFHAVELSLSADTSSKSSIEQWLITVDKDTKSTLLSHLIKHNDWQQGLIFVRTKHGVAKLANQLQKRGIEAEAIHSDKSQAVRSQMLADFKAGDIQFLVATDIASRGIDIDDLARVINYDLPNDANDYIHRIGRTGRAGNSGEAVSLVSRDDFKSLCAIESRLGHIITRNDLEDFKPRKEVPISILDYVPKNQRSEIIKPQNETQKSKTQNKKTAVNRNQNSTKAAEKSNISASKKPANSLWGSKKTIWDK